MVSLDVYLVGSRVGSTKRAIIIRDVLINSNSNPPPSTNPDYDSGWLTLQAQPYILSHNLGTKNVFVYTQYKIHDKLMQPDRDLVQWWDLTETEISIRGMGFSSDEKFRILIWKL